jgi:hypothetical protein
MLFHSHEFLFFFLPMVIVGFALLAQSGDAIPAKRDGCSRCTCQGTRIGTKHAIASLPIWSFALLTERYADRMTEVRGAR